MSSLPPGKGRTLTYSERRATADAGDSAYRWFEELVYNERRSVAIALPTARLVNSTLWVAAATATTLVFLLAAATSTPWRPVYLVAALVSAVAVVPSRTGWNRAGLEHLRPAPWAWPTLTALAGNLDWWSVAAAAAILVLPGAWWPGLGVAALAATIAGSVTGYAWLPLAAVAAAALLALKLAPPNPPGRGMPSGPINLLAAWVRPPINTNRLHKPLPNRSLPWFLYLLNPAVRRTITEARKNRADQKTPIPETWAAKIVGAVGERTTAMHLLGLPRNAYIQAHDLHVPVDADTSANIDHVIVGPTGTWIVDAKQYRGELMVSDHAVRSNTADLAPMLRTLAWEASCLSSTLGTPVNAIILVPDGTCAAPIEVTVPAQRNASAAKISIIAIPHLQDWIEAQDPTVYTGIERLRIAATLAITTCAAVTRRTPHLTLSRGTSYRTSTRGSLAPVTVNLAQESR